MKINGDIRLIVEEVGVKGVLLWIMFGYDWCKIKEILGNK